MICPFVQQVQRALRQRRRERQRKRIGQLLFRRLKRGHAHIERRIDRAVRAGNQRRLQYGSVRALHKYFGRADSGRIRNLNGRKRLRGMSRAHALCKQPFGGLAPERVQHRCGRERVCIRIDRKLAQYKRRIAQTGDLRADAVGVGGFAGGGLHGIALGARSIYAVRQCKARAFADAQINFAMDRKFLVFACKACLHRRHLRLRNQPNQPVAALCRRKIAIAHRNILIPAPQNQRIAAVYRSIGNDDPVFPADPDFHAQMVGAFGVHQFMILHAEAVALRKAAAVEHLLQIALRRVRIEGRAGGDRRQRVAVDARNLAHVFGALQSSLDFQTVRARIDQAFQPVQPA